MIEAPLYVSTRNAEFKWTDKCDVSFTKLQNMVSTTLFLRGPNLNLPFHILGDTSDTLIGVVI